MSKFRTGDAVRVTGQYYGNMYQKSGSVGTVVEIGEEYVIAQFPQKSLVSGSGCTDKWRDPELCCEWFPDSNNELELVTPHKSLDIPGYVPPAGWRIKADDEVVKNGDAFSHHVTGTLWPEPNTATVFSHNIQVGRAREYYMGNGGYVLAPVVIAPVSTPTPEPEPKRSWYVCPGDGLGGRPVAAFYWTEQEALDYLIACDESTILYRCVPIAKKTSQIAMISDE